MTEEHRLKAERIKKLAKLRELGVDPYGGRYEGVEAIAEVRARGEALGIEAGYRAKNEPPQPCGLGRIRSGENPG